jgi:tRNA pseudouridine55 synthase
LVVLVGRATKGQRAFVEARKRYVAVAQLGAVSTTGDTEGQITQTGRIPADPPTLPTGAVRQRPPRHSAVRIGGQRAYKRARRGEQFELPERIVTVYRFEQLWRETAGGLSGAAGPRAGFEIECAAGTYIRSLIAELGDAYCLELRRTAIGPFDVRDAVSPPRPGADWSAPPLLDLEQALAGLEASAQPLERRGEEPDRLEAER